MPSMRCVGYRQAWAHLDGRLDLGQLRATGSPPPASSPNGNSPGSASFRESWPALIEFDCLSDDLAHEVLLAAQRFVDA